ncbi:subtype B tannase [Streptomyces sp. NPDC001795]|uniref:subtype B tannase n=1 Tax=unclassified Streptomyces TaxID=2593676 RepID=UPI003317EEC1
MQRRSVLKTMTGAALIPVVAGCTDSGSGSSSPSSSSSSSKTYSLDFNSSSYTTLTKTVNTGSGSKKVTYRFYKNNVYVQHPVNYKYQSLNVSVPVAIDGKAVDATRAPIMFAINVGGYTSSSTWGATAQGGGMSAGSFGGGFGSGKSSSGSTPAGGSGSGAPSGSAPPGGGAGGAAAGASSAGLGSSMGSYWSSYDNGETALAHGYVVVEPGCRGRDQKWSGSNGTYYGKAPAAIVDLKAALRYLRHNKDRIPGNKDWIITSGGSAGGALSALVGASGNSTLYDAELKALGAADADDNVFLSACYSPITDLEHSDGQYEWMWGTLTYQSMGGPGSSSSSPTSSASSGSSTVDQTISGVLKKQFTSYLQQLALPGINGFGTLTTDNYSSYMMKEYLIPAATTALTKTLTASERTSYLKKNTWITWSGGKATFTWEDFLKHVGTRMKTAPAFDTFDLSAAENIEYGNATTNARHFTLYSLRHASGNSSARLDSDLPAKLNQMNPMYHLENKNPSRARHWWLRTGTLDTNTSHTVVCNLAAITTRLGDEVNSALYWDGGHAVNYDAPALFTWITKLTGYSVA